MFCFCSKKQAAESGICLEKSEFMSMVDLRSVAFSCPTQVTSTLTFTCYRCRLISFDLYILTGFVRSHHKQFLAQKSAISFRKLAIFLSGTGLVVACLYYDISFAQQSSRRSLNAAFPGFLYRLRPLSTKPRLSKQQVSSGPLPMHARPKGLLFRVGPKT